MQRKAVRFVGAQEAWARPVGEFAQRIFTRAFDAWRPAKDALNGVWFGHPVHPALTDVPVGAMTTATDAGRAG